ncbi:MAG: hypothetical protein EOO39_10555 [Cytophagaceae bacterium]|nr:MAG: hypothetical protein EOO39_10555 [Cytophagaceae bacterium]
MTEPRSAEDVLNEAKITMAKLKLMDEIGAFAYAKLTEEEINDKLSNVLTIDNINGFIEHC